MTEPPPSRWWPKVLLALGIVALLLLAGAWFLTTATFWEGVGWRLVAAVQDRINGEVAVGKVSGNLVTGMVFTDVKITRSGDDIIRMQELEVSLSILSFLKLQPVIRTLAFRQPNVFLRQDAAGTWNVAGLLKKRPPPPFSRIDLSNLQVQDGRLQVDRAGRSLSLQDLQVQLSLTVQAPGRTNLAVIVQKATLGFLSPPYPAVLANLALTYTAQEIQLHPTQVSLAGIPVLDLQGKLTDLGGTPHLVFVSRTTELSGPQLHRLWPSWPESLPARAGLEVNGPLSDLQIRGSGAIQDGSWKATGSWRQPEGSPPTFELAGDFSGLSEALVSAWPRLQNPAAALTPLSGAVTLSGEGLPWPPGNLQARLTLQPFSFRQARFESVALTVKLSENQQQTLNITAQGNFGLLEGEASGRLLTLAGPKTGSAGEIKLRAQGFNPMLLLGPAAPPGALQAAFTGNFQLPPSLDWRQASLTGVLQSSGTVKEHAFQEFSVTGGWEAGELRFSPARLVMGPLRAEAQGKVSRSGADLKMQLQLASSAPFPLLPGDFRGQVRAEGTVQGAWQALAYQVSWQAQSLSWRQVHLEALSGRAAGVASREMVSVSQFNLRAENLVTPLGRFGLIQGSGQTQGTNLAFSLSARESPGQSGTLTGVAAWEKNAAQIKISSFLWGPPDLQVAAAEPVTLSLAPGRFELSPLRLRYRQTQLFLAGRLSQEDAALQLKLENLQFADIAQLVPQVAILKGSVQAQAEISGSGRAPLIRGQVEVSPGQISRFHFDSFQTAWQYHNNQLSLSGHLLEKPDQGKVSWQGTAPLTLALLPWTWQIPDSGLQLKVWSERVTLGLFSQLIPEVSASEGPMSLQAEATGSLRRPLLSGALRYGPGTLTVRESGAPFAIEPGEIRLEGERLVLGGLVFRSGNGQAVITGGARLAGLKLEGVNLNLAATNLQIIRREGSHASASGQISLTGSWPSFRVDGHLTATEGQFRLAFFRSERNREIILLPRVCRPPAKSTAHEGAVAVERNFLLNLVIDIPGGVWLQDKDVKAELEGQLKVLRQTLGPKYLGGWVRAKGGVFAINNKIFTVEKAMLTFPGQPHKPTLVEARAYRQVDEYTLRVFASGPLDNPRTGLESNPPLPSRDQLSLLVFDHLADKMTREEYVTATQKAMGMFGSLTFQKLRSLLGDGLPFLGEVSPTTSQESLGLGKKLSQDITVSYERKLNPLQGEDVNQVRLDYKIHKHFSAETQLGRKNTGGDIFFNIDF